MGVVKKMLIDLKMLIGLILQAAENMRAKAIIMLECYKITPVKEKDGVYFCSVTSKSLNTLIEEFKGK